MNQAKILAVVLRMATYARLVGLFNADDGSMESTPLGNAVVNLLVALGAPEDGRSGKETMAGEAIQGPGEVAVGPRNRARRHLRPHGGTPGDPQENQKVPQELQ